MLALAIKARIPVVRAYTSDIINLPDVLKHLAPKLQFIETKGGSVPIRGADVIYAIDEIEVSRPMFESLVESQRTLLLINQGGECPYAFDAGEVPVPKELMIDVLKQVSPAKAVPELLPCFNGLTLKGMYEVIRLTQARDKSLTARGVTQIRANLIGKIQGLGQVNTTLPLYICPPALEAWTKKNKRFFLEAQDLRLVPRGILLAGEPGVGKTQAGKYIATEFDVPLYRLDLSAALSKWIGEAESNLARVLNTLDQEEPAVMLIDETEKIFGESEDQGTTARMLSQLLWWLQEHTSRVLTVMTTNNKDALPRELYRAGRVDTVLTLEPLTEGAAYALLDTALTQFIKLTPDKRKEAVQTLRLRMGKSSKIAHAEVVQLAVDLAKEKGWLAV